MTEWTKEILYNRNRYHFHWLQWITGLEPTINDWNLQIIMLKHLSSQRYEEHGGSVVEYLTRDWGVAGLSLTGHFILSLVLVKPRKTRPNMTEKLLTGMQRINTTKLTKLLISSCLFEGFLFDSQNNWYLPVFFNVSHLSLTLCIRETP